MQLKFWDEVNETSSPSSFHARMQKHWIPIAGQHGTVQHRVEFALWTREDVCFIQPVICIPGDVASLHLRAVVASQPVSQFDQMILLNSTLS